MRWNRSSKPRAAIRSHLELIRERYEELAARLFAADPDGGVNGDPLYSETSWPTPAEEARAAACPMCGARAGEASRAYAPESDACHRGALREHRT